MARSMRQEFLNIPNTITFARISVIPIFCLFTYYADPLHSWWAATLFTAASATDFLDGYLARRLNLVTLIGKFIDPLADKLIVMAALVMLVRLGRVSSWLVIVLLGRELVISGLRTIALGEGLVISASQGGKWKTALQLVGIAMLLMHYEHVVGFGPVSIPVDFNRVGTVLLYFSLVASLVSAADYFLGFVRKFREGKGRRPTLEEPGDEG